MFDCNWMLLGAPYSTEKTGYRIAWRYYYWQRARDTASNTKSNQYSIAYAVHTVDIVLVNNTKWNLIISKELALESKAEQVSVTEMHHDDGKTSETSGLMNVYVCTICMQVRSVRIHLTDNLHNIISQLFLSDCPFFHAAAASRFQSFFFSLRNVAHIPQWLFMSGESQRALDSTPFYCLFHSPYLVSAECLCSQDHIEGK